MNSFDKDDQKDSSVLRAQKRISSKGLVGLQRAAGKNDLFSDIFAFPNN